MKKAPAPPAPCTKRYGRGLGGVKRLCHRLAPHKGTRCYDMPFLDHLWDHYPKVADKIERDSSQTRGASWGKNQKGQQKRRNRQPRWTLAEGHPA